MSLKLVNKANIKRDILTSIRIIITTILITLTLQQSLFIKVTPVGPSTNLTLVNSDICIAERTSMSTGHIKR